MKVVSLFSGIGGLDLGLEDAGMSVVSLCESWEPARSVLASRFPGVPVAPDVLGFSPADSYDLLAAGFPCTNISHVGDKSGLAGPASGLVSEVFRIARDTSPRWILLENVPNLLTLHRGAAMRSITRRLEGLGYRWAYRTVDSRFTGLPQRRPRVIILASADEDPAAVLLSQDAGPVQGPAQMDAAGFYWTEGRHGTGLVWGAVPTLKGGSTIGLGSSPAVWLRSRPAGRQIVTLAAEHGELLQGLPAGWTTAASAQVGPDMRWKLVGNAVTTGVGRWVGSGLVAGSRGDALGAGLPISVHRKWPGAGSGGPGQVPCSHEVSAWPERHDAVSLPDVLAAHPAPLLSTRAAAGFLRRLEASGLPFEPSLRQALSDQVSAAHPPAARAARPLAPAG